MSRRLPARERILDAGARLLTSGEPASMEEIAGEAGVSRATLYRAFRTREDLLAGLRDERGLELSPKSNEERILDAAGRLVGARGPRSVTMEEIAEEAGLGLATLYRTFGERDELLSALLERRSPRTLAAGLLTDLEAPLEESLVAFAAVMLGFAEENPGLIGFVLTASDEERDWLEALHSSQERSRRRLARYLQAQIDQGRLKDAPASDLAVSFVSLLLASGSVAPRWLQLGPSKGSIEKRARRVVDLFLDGARSR